MVGLSGAKFLIRPEELEAGVPVFAVAGTTDIMLPLMLISLSASLAVSFLALSSMINKDEPCERLAIDEVEGSTSLLKEETARFTILKKRDDIEAVLGGCCSDFELLLPPALSCISVDAAACPVKADFEVATGGRVNVEGEVLGGRIQIELFCVTM